MPPEIIRQQPLSIQADNRADRSWLGDQDSNLDKQIQSLPCYHYTISQWVAPPEEAMLILLGDRVSQQGPVAPGLVSYPEPP